MRIKEAIIVEGQYDKIKLDSIVDALVVPTFGFSIFTDEARLSYLCTLAKKTGVIILTDSDSAGFRIRQFLEKALPEGTVRHAYIPTVAGKEKRKRHPSREGSLGVEGQSRETLTAVLQKAATPIGSDVKSLVTKQDFYKDGLSGSAESAKRRALLCKALALPPKLSVKALLGAVNALMSYDEYKEWCTAQLL